MLDPLVIAPFCNTNAMPLKNPHEYVDRFIRDEIYAKTLSELSGLKAELGRKHKDQEKADKEFQDHVMVRYDEKLTERTYGFLWMTILQERLKYPGDTFYINSPPQHRLTPEEEHELDAACLQRDLFVLAGFIKPGK